MVRFCPNLAPLTVPEEYAIQKRTPSNFIFNGMKKSIFILTAVASLLASSLALAQNININSSGIRVTGPESIELNNVKVVGLPNSFKATFIWNPAELKFVLSSGEAYTQNRYVATTDPLTIGSASFSVDPNAHCFKQAGAGYRAADWSDIKTDVNNNPDNAIKISGMVSKLTTQRLFISYENLNLTSDGYPYAIGFKNGGGLSLYDDISSTYGGNVDQILAGTFATAIYRSKNFNEWNVLCVNPNNRMP